MNRGVFLDRDGVLVADNHLLTKIEDIHVFEGVPAALALLKEFGFYLIEISNQTVISRGLLTEKEMLSLNDQIDNAILNGNGPQLDAFYYCPHHPNATLETYRQDCDCRKPKPGLIIQAAEAYSIDLSQSFMIGDRITDIIAGQRAGCRTILLETGMHKAVPIQTVEPLDVSVTPNYTCSTLLQAAEWIGHVSGGNTRTI